MKNNLMLAFSITIIVLLAGCNRAGTAIDSVSSIASKPDEIGGTGEPEILAGSSSKYYAFSGDAYEKALAEDKIILLYFYANWCPICKAEQPSTKAAFDEIDNPGIVGFRVNYKDSDTDDYEEQLAKEFGITYQHTKVLLKNGERVLKAPDTWNKARYLEELMKAE